MILFGRGRCCSGTRADRSGAPLRSARPRSRASMAGHRTDAQERGRGGGDRTFQPARAFSFFLKVGAVLYGSGYVLLAFLKRPRGSPALDYAVAIARRGCGRPGHSRAGLHHRDLHRLPARRYDRRGGCDDSDFRPGFIFVAASRPLIARIRRSMIAGAFLDGVNVGALALLAAVHLATRPGRAGRRNDRRGGRGERPAVDLLAGELARGSSSAAGMAGLIATRWLR